MTKALLRRFTIMAAGSALFACGLIAGIDDYHIGDCKGGQCGADGGGFVDDVPFLDSGYNPPVDSGVACVGMPLPPSIRVGESDNTFCIDTTEVTNGGYNTFLDAGVPLTGQSGECQWNVSYVPTPAVPPDPDAAVVIPPDDFPVVNVDFCDAVAYCAWAGKYLCGAAAAGHKIGPVTEEGLSDYKTNQWMLACSAEARLRYPYGGVYDPTKCNVVDYDAGGLVAVGSTQCIGGYEGLSDMVGNAWEWIDGPCHDDGGLKPDAAEGPEGDSCDIKGGSFYDDGPTHDCRYDYPGIRRDFHGTNVGFRCCSD